MVVREGIRVGSLAVELLSRQLSHTILPKRSPVILALLSLALFVVLFNTHFQKFCVVISCIVFLIKKWSREALGSWWSSVQ
jgi:hypothetical protein